jgi:hypothetical protein
MRRSSERSPDSVVLVGEVQLKDASHTVTVDRYKELVFLLSRPHSRRTILIVQTAEVWLLE